MGAFARPQQCEITGTVLEARRLDPGHPAGRGTVSKDDLVDLLVDEMNTAFHGTWTIDELCLHPR